MQMRAGNIYLMVLLIQPSIITSTTNPGETNLNSSPIEIDKINIERDTGNNVTATVYAKLFAERRKVHQAMVKELLTSANYEKTFKLLKLAYGNIFEIITDKNMTLLSKSYEPSRDGFPKGAHLQDAVTLILENCCIAAESLLHFPDISYRIFRKNAFLHWKVVFNWCIDFVNSLTHLTDESTNRLMQLLQQEVNEDLRTKNYINPYYKITNDANGTRRKQKRPSKLKNRPQLSGSKDEL